MQHRNLDWTTPGELLASMAIDLIKHEACGLAFEFSGTMLFGRQTPGFDGGSRPNWGAQ